MYSPDSNTSPVRLKDWIAAARLRTLPLALSSIGLGGFLAALFDVFQPLIFILCLLTTLFLQVLSNYANDYGDTVHGADSKFRQGPSRAVQSGRISRVAMKTAIIIFSVLSLITGFTLLSLAFKSLETSFFIFLILGIASIAAAIKYTAGKKPYGYSGLGDLFVFLFFGLVAVSGTFYLQATFLPAEIFLPAVSAGMFSTAVLNINNIRDIESDKLAGKFSIPVRIGEKKAKIYHILLLFAGWVTAIWFTVIYFVHPIQLLFLLALPLFIMNVKNVWEKSAKALDPCLKQMALSTLIFVLLFGIGLIIA